VSEIRLPEAGNLEDIEYAKIFASKIHHHKDDPSF
jgi:hypothetical protein